MTRPARYTIADWLAQPEERRVELIDGEFVEKAAPSFEHGRAQGRTSGTLGQAFDRRPGGPQGPGGWVIVTEVDIVLDGRGFRPAIAGWRRDRLSTPPKERPVTTRPDWICEIVSASNRQTDTVTKLRCYQEAGVPHFWILDPDARSLTVYRHRPDGYLLVLVAAADERVRAEPFDAIELQVGVLLGDDPEDFAPAT